MKNLSEMSVEELQKQEKTLKTVTGVSAGIVTVLAALLVFLVISDGSLTIPLALMPIVLINLAFLAVNWNTIKKIKAELDSRTIL
ncbi:MAG: redox-active disulfide protein 2 [Spirosomataceae bacterium]